MPGGSCSATRRVKSARAPVTSTGIVAAVSAFCSTALGPVSVTVAGSAIAAETASDCGGVPTRVGTTETTLLITAWRTDSVMATAPGLTATPVTTWPPPSAGTTCTEATTC